MNKSRQFGLFTDIPDELWNDWRWQVQNRIETLEDLKKYIALTPEGTTEGRTVLQVPLSIDGEPEGLLRPGSYGTINIYGFTSGALLFTIKPVDE